MKKRKPSWDNSFPVLERKIPDYDPLKDEFCAFTRTKTFTKYAQKRGDIDLNKLGPVVKTKTKKIDNGKARTKKEDLPCRAMKWKKKNGVGSISEQLVSDEDKPVEMALLKLVLERENLLQLAKQLFEDKREKIRCFRVLQEIVQKNVLVVEGVSRWRKCIMAPTKEARERVAFMYDDKNYLLKMITDFDFVASNKAFAASLIGHLGFDGEVVDFKRNPFLARESIPRPPSNPAAVSPCSLTKELEKRLRIGDGIRAVEEQAQNLPADDTSYIPSLGERRMEQAKIILMIEEARQVVENQQARSYIEFEDNFLKEKNKNKAPEIARPGTVQPGKTRQQQKMTQLARPSTTSAPNREHMLTGKAKKKMALPPLQKEDLRFLRGNEIGTLTRMDQDVEVCEEHVAFLEQGIEFMKQDLETRRQKLQMKLRKGKAKLTPLKQDAQKRLICDLEHKIQKMERDLGFRRIELNQKKLTRHLFVENQAKKLQRRIEEEIRQEIAEKRRLNQEIQQLSAHFALHCIRQGFVNVHQQQESKQDDEEEKEEEEEEEEVEEIPIQVEEPNPMHEYIFNLLVQTMADTTASAAIQVGLSNVKTTFELHKLATEVEETKFQEEQQEEAEKEKAEEYTEELPEDLYNLLFS